MNVHHLQGGEGCLSVDREVPGYVPRYTRITVKATSINGEEVKLRLKGLPAIVFQHEIDHLNGVMFYDHINKENPFAAPDDCQTSRAIIIKRRKLIFRLFIMKWVPYSLIAIQPTLSP